MVPPWYTPEILVSVVTVVSKVATVPGMGDLRECCGAMQLRGMSKVVTLTFTGLGFGLCRAQLVTLSPKPFHIYTLKPYTTPPPTGGVRVQTLNPKPNTHHHTTGRGKGLKH